MRDSTSSVESLEASPVVHIVDDDAAVRDSLRMLCDAANLFARTYPSAAAFLRQANFAGGGCIVLDIRMPGTSGLEVQEELHKRRIRLPVIFLTGHADVAMAVRAMKRGAFDFIEKPPEPQALLLTIHNALRTGRKREDPNPATPCERSRTAIDREQLLNQLTEREREVLEMILQGVQSRAIAQTLSLSLKTVEFHRARIREKAGVGSTLELVRLMSG